MPERIYRQTAPSHTKGRLVELMASPEFLCSSDRILIVDDFLATGQTISALVRLVEEAGAELVGIGVLIEKRFEGGRALLEGLGIPIESLVVITDMSDGRIVFGE
jgi:xanthine phosphoribosyltransferase